MIAEILLMIVVLLFVMGAMLFISITGALLVEILIDLIRRIQK